MSYDRIITHIEEILKKIPTSRRRCSNPYCQKDGYHRAWEDACKAQGLGYPLSPGFFRTFRETAEKRDEQGLLPVTFRLLCFRYSVHYNRKYLMEQTRAMDPGEKIEYLREYITLLDRGVCAFNKKIHQPIFDPARGGRFRYKEPNPVTFLVLKMARMVTAFYAALTLTKDGLFEDAGAICRIIIECRHDIDFVMEGLLKDPFQDDKQEVVDNFFNEEIQTPKEMLGTMKKPPTIPRKKIYPAVGRLLSPGNPDRSQRIAKVLKETFSGYVHASYPHIMEMYEGTRKEFRMSGVQMRIPIFIKQVALNIHAALNQFAILAKALDLTDLKLQLLASVKELENSEAYK